MALVSEVGELISMIPRIVGYHPADELVVVFTCDNLTRAVLGVPLPVDATEERLTSVRAVVKQHSIDGYHVIGYGPEALVATGVGALRSRLPPLAAHGIYRVDNGRYYAIMCPATCSCSAAERCSPGGNPLPDAPPAVVEQIVAGQAAAADRGEALQFLIPTAGQQRHTADYETLLACYELVSAHITADRRWEPDARRIVEDARDLVETASTVWRQRTLTDREIARLALAMHIHPVRVEAVRRAANVVAEGDPDDIAAHVGVWLDVMRRSHTLLMPVAAAVYACVAYTNRQTLHAAAAAQIALNLNAECEFAHHIDQIVTRLVPFSVHLDAVTGSIAELRHTWGTPRRTWLNELGNIIAAVYAQFSHEDRVTALRLVPQHPRQPELLPPPAAAPGSS
ncbi:DUF4192 family protein [Nonomuraea polychroma]|uniref:DUF4192 family protein n=1 Tax=Nonomuraea polychroma TaxID=46176 RepID=UPI003D8E82DE